MGRFNVPTGIVKKDKVRKGQAVPIGPGMSASAVGHVSHGGGNARIVGQNENGAIIEVICGCGNTMQVVCEFPAVPEAGSPVIEAEEPVVSA